MEQPETCWKHSAWKKAVPEKTIRYLKGLGGSNLLQTRCRQAVPQPAGDRLGRVGIHKCMEFLFMNKQTAPIKNNKYPLWFFVSLLWGTKACKISPEKPLLQIKGSSKKSGLFSCTACFPASVPCKFKKTLPSLLCNTL